MAATTRILRTTALNPAIGPPQSLKPDTFCEEMTCPRCSAAMQEHAFDDQLGRPIAVDLCEPCQSIWFDGRESPALTPAATLSLFRIIGEHVSKPQLSDADTAKCPRC